jgi:predicted DNA binding CopG/RHH family protein
MTRVISLRLPAVLERAVRNHAAQSRMPVPDIVRLILEHSLGGQYRFSELRAVEQSLDAKLDVRLPEDLVAKLRGESARLGISVSVYSRVILYAYYTKRLVFIEIGDRYTLAENHDQTKSA